MEATALHDEQPAALSLSAIRSQYLIGGMMQNQLIPCNQALQSSKFGRSRAGWQCYEGPGVQPYWTGEHAKEDAIGYATARAKFGRGEIRVLNNAGEVARVISFDQTEK